MNKAKYQKMYTEKYKQDMDFVIIGDYYIGPFIDMDVAQKAVSAINKQYATQPKTTKQSAAIDTLERMGYEWHGGEWVKQKPVEYEYIKVTDSIFDLRDEFERGELYFDKDNCGGGIYCNTEKYQPMLDISDFKQAALDDNLYRRIEKQIDWRDDVYDYLGDCQWFDGNTSIGNTLMSEHASSAFLELCRTALRARGEL